MSPGTLRHAVLPLALLLYVTSGCTPREAADSRRAVVETYAEIVAATYEDSLAAARSLDHAVDALLASPSQDTLNLARERWMQARTPYGYSEAFRFYGGPIDGEGGPVQLGTLLRGPIAAGQPRQTLVLRHPEVPPP